MDNLDWSLWKSLWVNCIERTDTEIDELIYDNKVYIQFIRDFDMMGDFCISETVNKYISTMKSENKLKNLYKNVKKLKKSLVSLVIEKYGIDKKVLKKLNIVWEIIDIEKLFWKNIFKISLNNKPTVWLIASEYKKIDLKTQKNETKYSFTYPPNLWKHWWKRNYEEFLV